MHICFPYSEDLAEKVAECMEKFKPNLTIIESTVQPGTTSLIWRLTDGKHRLVHSPVRGNKRDSFKWAYFTYTNSSERPHQKREDLPKRRRCCLE